MKKSVLTTLTVLSSALVLSGCGETTPTDQAAAPEDSAIIEALNEIAPTKTPESNGRNLTIERSDYIANLPEPEVSGISSVAEAPVLDVKTEEPEVEYNSTNDNDKKDENVTGNGTPLIFDVSDCTVVAYGDFDDSMESAILAAINAYRTRGGLTPIETNLSLEFCADVRSKEITCNFSHTRPNNTFWYTVAPAYARAELIAADYSTAQRTVDAWMSTSSGRQYLLSDELKSIGISAFKSDGRNYVVATLGI